MRKLRLDPDAMQVESFSPQALPAERGTAFGYSGAYGPGCASEWPNCGDNPDISGWSCNLRQAARA